MTFSGNRYLSPAKCQRSFDWLIKHCESDVIAHAISRDSDVFSLVVKPTQ